jgi:hypothetical protein
VLRRLLLIALVSAVGSCRPDEKSAELPADPAVLSLLARPTLDGPAFDPASLVGKITVLNFWSPG